MSDLYDEVWIESETGGAQGPFETRMADRSTEVWIYDETAVIETGAILIRKMTHGQARYLITAIRDERPSFPDGRQGPLRRCLSVQRENENLADALCRLALKITAAPVAESEKLEAKIQLASLIRLPLVAGILNGGGWEVLEKLK
jgi:hypothetical protein